MSKTVKFVTPQTSQKPIVDEWVKKREVPDVPLKRYSIDLPVDLHKRIKLQCIQRDQVMSEVIRNLLEREFPPTELDNS